MYGVISVCAMYAAVAGDASAAVSRVSIVYIYRSMAYYWEFDRFEREDAMIRAGYNIARYDISKNETYKQMIDLPLSGGETTVNSLRWFLQGDHINVACFEHGEPRALFVPNACGLVKIPLTWITGSEQAPIYDRSVYDCFAHIDGRIKVQNIQNSKSSTDISAVFSKLYSIKPDTVVLDTLLANNYAPSFNFDIAHTLSEADDLHITLQRLPERRLLSLRCNALMAKFQQHESPIQISYEFMDSFHTIKADDVLYVIRDQAGDIMSCPASGTTVRLAMIQNAHGPYRYVVIDLDRKRCNAYSIIDAEGYCDCAMLSKKIKLTRIKHTGSVLGSARVQDIVLMHRQNSS